MDWSRVTDRIWSSLDSNEFDTAASLLVKVWGSVEYWDKYRAIAGAVALVSGVFKATSDVHRIFSTVADSMQLPP